ncbi:MAG: glycoside-pentoside-hexuronide (GPH):cation symporter [Treponema sp.]|nr:glycoside-pentoside-hexuronide (GPH):cation symporter [Treponema sp.]
MSDESAIRQSAIPPLKLHNKIGYGLGDFASSMSWTFIGSYFAIFLTDMAGIPAGIVSIILLVTKIWDAVNDPMVGAIEERTKSKWGRFRPWILWSALPLAAANIMCFTAPFKTITGMVAWAVAGYVLVDTFYGFVNLGYGALSTTMTYDPKERTELNSWRTIGNNLGGIVLGGLTMPCVLFFSGGHKPVTHGYTIAAMIFSFLAIPLFVIVFFTTREVVKPLRKENISVIESIRATVTNRPLVFIFIIIMCFAFTLTMHMSMSVYYYMYNLGRPDMIAPLMMIASILCTVTVYIFKNIIDRVGKIKMLIISNVVFIVSLSGLFLINPVDQLPLVFVFQAIFGIAMGIGQPIYFALVPEAIDYYEDKTNIRADGVSYTSISLATKIGSAVGSSLGIAILAIFGYAANAQQTAHSLTGINIAANGVPIIFCVLSIGITLFYPLSTAKNTEIRARLEAKRDT